MTMSYGIQVSLFNSIQCYLFIFFQSLCLISSELSPNIALGFLLNIGGLKVLCSCRPIVLSLKFSINL